MQPWLVPESSVALHRVNKSLGHHNGVQTKERGQFTYLLTPHEVHDLGAALPVGWDVTVPVHTLMTFVPLKSCG